jgi:transposase
MRQDSNSAIGVDLGDTYSHVCVLGADGEVEEEARIQTTRKAFEKRFARSQGVRIAVETGTHSPWVSRVLERCGATVFVAQSRKLRMISRNDSKCDRTDAEMLARLARLDPHLLAPIRHRGTETQADLGRIRSRQALVRARADLVNHVRGSVPPDARGVRSDGIGVGACVQVDVDRAAGNRFPALFRGSRIRALRDPDFIFAAVDPRSATPPLS